jgi:hypothetical protein
MQKPDTAGEPLSADLIHAGTAGTGRVRQRTIDILDPKCEVMEGVAGNGQPACQRSLVLKWPE